MYKLTRPDGTDFHTGKINYADNIGKIIRVPYDDASVGECGRGLHSCRNVNDCFVGAKIPCRVFRVDTRNVIVRGKKKTRSQGLKIIEELQPEDVFDWNYSEACNPINPLKIKPPRITDAHIELVKQWDSIRSSVWDSVRNSIRSSIGDSVWVSVGSPVWGSVGSSVWNSIRDSVWLSAGHSIRDSVLRTYEDSIWAYVGSLFPNIQKWKYIKHTRGVYPFQPAVDLWKQGLVPSYDGKVWRLRGGEKGAILWQGEIELKPSEEE